MEDLDEVLITVDKLSSVILVKIVPNFENFIDVKDETTVKLNKTLYGFVQSAYLWFETLNAELKSNEYVQNSIDPCVK